jgi:hypothetical protein
MKLTTVLVAVVVTTAGCAGHSQRSAVSPSLRWQQEMDRARRAAAAGQSYGLTFPWGVYVFYNNPAPLCYAYTIPGTWKEGEEARLYRSSDGRAQAGVSINLTRDFDGVEGATVVERARTIITRGYERRLGVPLPDVELVPFESTRAGVWRWKAKPVLAPPGGRYVSFSFPTKFIVDLSPDAVAVVTIDGTGDDDGLARRIIETLRTTARPECYWSDLEDLLKGLTGGR